MAPDETVLKIVFKILKNLPLKKEKRHSIGFTGGKDFPVIWWHAKLKASIYKSVGPPVRAKKMVKVKNIFRNRLQ